MKLSLARTCVVLVAVALGGPALAQQVVFHDGFENGLSNWTATGLWNLEDSSDPCGAQAGPFVEGTKAAWYGAEPACDFATPSSNAGSLASNNWIQLPDSPSISLRFWSWSQTEYCWGAWTLWDTLAQWDVHAVVIEAQNGPDAGFTQQLCSFNGPTWLLLPWHERRIDLSAYRGASVRVKFAFATHDDEANWGLGWLIDDVSIIAEPGSRVCPSAGLNSGCPCMSAFVPVAGGCRNSTEQSATLLSGGTASVAQDTLVFTAAHMPPGTSPTLFQGTSLASQAVFGDGLRCVGGSQRRLGTQHSPTGVTSWPAPAAPSISTLGLVPPEGGTRYYQAVYRNALDYCTQATFNLTDAQRVVWLP